jgi:hypothetical protein
MAIYGFLKSTEPPFGDPVPSIRSVAGGSDPTAQAAIRMFAAFMVANIGIFTRVVSDLSDISLLLEDSSVNLTLTGSSLIDVSQTTKLFMFFFLQTYKTIFLILSFNIF